jgi:hypothetical protein
MFLKSHRRTFVLTLVILSTAAIALAQRKAGVRGVWQTFTVGDVSVETPVKLVDRWGDAKDEFSRYAGVSKESYFYVFKDSFKKPHGSKVILRFIESAGQKLQPDGQLLSFKDQYGYYNHVVVFHAGGHVYIAQTVSPNENDAEAAGFISSFKLQSSAPPQQATTEEPERSDDPQESLSVPMPLDPAGTQGGGMGSGIGSGNGGGTGAGSGPRRSDGIGSGIGSGSGSGSKPNEPVPVTANANSPLRLISRARPAYTDWARFYDITGTVVVRVAFLGSGEIGQVSAVTRLPFGLTEQAIEAAKRIRFEPKMVNGRGVSTARQVEYTFSIY